MIKYWCFDPDTHFATREADTHTCKAHKVPLQFLTTHIVASEPIPIMTSLMSDKGRGNFKNILVKTVQHHLLGIIQTPCWAYSRAYPWMISHPAGWGVTTNTGLHHKMCMSSLSHFQSNWTIFPFFLQSLQGPSLSIFTVSLLSHISITNGVSFLNFACQPFLDMFSSLLD